jgi:hypothetical protein
MQGYLKHRNTPAIKTTFRDVVARTFMRSLGNALEPIDDALRGLNGITIDELPDDLRSVIECDRNDLAAFRKSLGDVYLEQGRSLGLINKKLG